MISKTSASIFLAVLVFFPHASASAERKNKKYLENAAFWLAPDTPKNGVIHLVGKPDFIDEKKNVFLYRFSVSSVENSESQTCYVYIEFSKDDKVVNVEVQKSVNTQKSSDLHK
ncbi:hypothetical protein Rhal01_03726 [Rubritalea halochordaticola]|uniref:Uncharacterized protein n=1 Tax=Rubritalea halochordaticola TaxID=714537 RepID=A0ABP9V650_9BACT